MKTVVYHKTELLAKRGRRPKPGETVWYKSITDQSKKFDDTMDNIEILCEVPKKAKQRSV